MKNALILSYHLFQPKILYDVFSRLAAQLAAEIRISVQHVESFDKRTEIIDRVAESRLLRR